MIGHPTSPSAAPVPPAWWEPLLEGVAVFHSRHTSWVAPPPPDGRTAAVLVLLFDGEDGPSVVLIERAPTLRSHAGQPAFPGGAVDSEDTGPVDAALREAREEVGLDTRSVRVMGELPPLWVEPSNFTVTPVLAWWHSPHALSVVDTAEVARVEIVRVADLADPGNRCRVGLSNGRYGPGFTVAGMLVWGFTGGLLDALLRMGGWERPWDRAAVRDRPR